MTAGVDGVDRPLRNGEGRVVPTLPASRDESLLGSSDYSDSRGLSTVGARAVSWWSVHEFVQKFLNSAGHYPMAGTPAWCELADGDRRKWAALLDFAQHHALRMETAQEAQADAAKAVAVSADWSGVAREMRVREALFASRPWLRRAS